MKKIIILPALFMAVTAFAATKGETNDYFGYDYNKLDVASEFARLQGGQTESTAVYGAALVPDSTLVYQSNAVAGYVVNEAPKTNVVAGYFQARNNASGTHSWGTNPVCATTAGFVDQICTGEEIDINAANARDNVTGSAIMGYWTAQPSSPTGYEVGPPGSPAGTSFKWAQSFFSLSGAAYYAFVAGYAQASGTSLSSQPIAYLSMTPAGTSSLSREYADWNGNAVWRTNRLSVSTVQPNVGPCGHANQGSMAVVIDATGPLSYMGTYVSGGSITAQIICSFDGSTYAWLTH
jgi:hypothetical protein